MASVRYCKDVVKWLIFVCIVSFFCVRFTHREKAVYKLEHVEWIENSDHAVTRSRISGQVSSSQKGHNVTLPTLRDETPTSTEGQSSPVPLSLSVEQLLNTEVPHRTPQYKSSTKTHVVSSEQPFRSVFNPAVRKINSIQSLDKQHGNWDNPANGSTGFVLSLDFWDQQTFSVGNILGLQCWAAWLGVHTIEPFLVGTKFKFPLEDHTAFHSNGSVSHVRMRDVYDIENWNSETGKLHYKPTPLSSWEEFLSTASRDVLFIKLESWKDCVLGDEVVSYNKTLTKLGFRLLSARCLRFNSREPISLSQFKTHVYGHLSPNQATVVFNSWSHMNTPYSTRNFQIGGNVVSGSIGVTLNPSKMLLNDVERYHRKYLPPGSRYIGVLVRAEWLIMNKGIGRREHVLKDCLNRAISWLHSITNQTQVSTVFVGMDIGKYGSTTLKDLNKDYALHLSEHFLRTAYNEPDITVKSWEQTFTDITTSKVPGYVAFLQKTLAIHGQCLLLIGFGSFQNHALQAYTRLREARDYCYLKTDSQCRIKSVVGFQPYPP